MKKTILILFSVIVLAAILLVSCRYKNNDNKISEIDLNGINKLMIVAHPDDEMLWGGAHLLADDYLVVCITSGNNRVRHEEFKKVMDKTHNKFLMLNYPNKTLFWRDDWQKVDKNIKEDLKKIIEYKDWDLIVTHNPDGEYGHIHHIMTSEFVTNLADKDKLYYFGRYYSRKNIGRNKGEQVSEDTAEKKRDILEIYDSQERVIEKLSHMIPYENWIKYDEWTP